MRSALCVDRMTTNVGGCTRIGAFKACKAVNWKPKRAGERVRISEAGAA